MTLIRETATLSVLICEDLARYDPVLTVMNAIGPNLVIALLMDGPQLERRWCGRYATALADDPGSSVAHRQLPWHVGALPNARGAVAARSGAVEGAGRSGKIPEAPVGRPRIAAHAHGRVGRRVDAGRTGGQAKPCACTSPARQACATLSRPPSGWASYRPEHWA